MGKIGKKRDTLGSLTLQTGRSGGALVVSNMRLTIFLNKNIKRRFPSKYKTCKVKGWVIQVLWCICLRCHDRYRIQHVIEV